MPSSRLLIPAQMPQQKTARDQRYFPVAVRFYSKGGSARKGLDLEMFDSDNMEVSLIPVLEDPQECSGISYPPDRETCSDLNFYRRAVLTQRPELCDKIRDNPLRVECERSPKRAK